MKGRNGSNKTFVENVLPLILAIIATAIVFIVAHA